MSKKTLGGYVPQKRRGRFRIFCGIHFYRTLRFLWWIRYGNRFAKKSGLDVEGLRQKFPFVVFSHSVPLYRNLSETDSLLQEGKVANLHLATKKISGAVVEPGKIFSYWKLIGNPTRMKGYKKGMMLENGRPVARTGGGLCALSNLVYWMTLHTNLRVAERWRHSFDVFPDSNRTQPFGSGATCVYNYRDLMVLNSTENPYALLVWIDGDKLCGEWRTDVHVGDSYEVYQKEHWITGEIGNVYVRHNRIYRKHFVDGQFYGEELVAENHAKMMYEPLLAQESK